MARFVQRPIAVGWDAIGNSKVGDQTEHARNLEIPSARGRGQRVHLHLPCGFGMALLPFEVVTDLLGSSDQLEGDPLITKIRPSSSTREGLISTSAEMPRRSCRRLIISSIGRVCGSAPPKHGPCPDDRFKVLPRKTLLLHAELDRLNRIGWVHWIVLRLIGIEQRCQHIEAIALGCSAPGAPQAFDLGAGLLVVRPS